MHHLFEIVLESHRMWVKFQASCSSSEQALAFLQSRLGGEDPDPPVPVYPYLSFEIPTNLSERVGNIANWESVKDSFPEDWMTTSSGWLKVPTRGARVCRMTATVRGGRVDWTPYSVLTLACRARRPAGQASLQTSDTWNTSGNCARG